MPQPTPIRLLAVAASLTWPLAFAAPALAQHGEHGGGEHEHGGGTPPPPAHFPSGPPHGPAPGRPVTVVPPPPAQHPIAPRPPVQPVPREQRPHVERDAHWVGHEGRHDDDVAIASGRPWPHGHFSGAVGQGPRLSPARLGSAAPSLLVRQRPTSSSRPTTSATSTIGIGTRRRRALRRSRSSRLVPGLQHASRHLRARRVRRRRSVARYARGRVAGAASPTSRSQIRLLTPRFPWPAPCNYGRRMVQASRPTRRWR